RDHAGSRPPGPPAGRRARRQVLRVGRSRGPEPAPPVLGRSFRPELASRAKLLELGSRRSRNRRSRLSHPATGRGLKVQTQKDDLTTRGYAARTTGRERSPSVATAIPGDVRRLRARALKGHRSLVSAERQEGDLPGLRANRPARASSRKLGGRRRRATSGETSGIGAEAVRRLRG